MPQALPAPVDDHPRVAIRLLPSLNKSEHSRPRKFLASIPPLKQAKHSSSGAWQTIKRADSAGTSIANDVRVDECIVLTMGKRTAIPDPSLSVHTSCEERLAPMLARIRLQGRIHALP